MGVYDDDITGADEDIREAGQLTQWIRPASGADPSSPWIETGADTIYNDIPVAFIPITARGYESLRAILGTEVPIGHDQGLMPGNAVIQPQLRDICIRADGRRYSVLDVETINVNGQIVLHTITFKEE